MFCGRGTGTCTVSSVVDPNPNVLAGSESEKKFGLGYGIGFRHCCRMKIFVKIRNQTLEREKSYVFLLKICFL
jgi:hypothetical protein